jgi:type III restriction enzyme
VLFDIEKLARATPSENERTKLPPTNTLDIHDFNEQEKIKLATKITPNNWIELLLSPLESQPIFKYRSREQEYIDFNDASAGQQATALMHVLLNQDGPPLIIDQPEDDLDSNIIDQVCTEIWSAKAKRQLVFSSHNANLVVNGDAELVISCDYRIAGDQSGGKIANQGAIDVEDVRKAITKIMEGGEKAFGLRRQKYGF